jgi:predicted TIM-barrel enzyme
MATKPWNKEDREEAERDFESFVNSGVQAEKLRDYCWRINGIIVFPSTKKYILNNKTYSYESLRELADINKIFIEP